MQEYLANSTFFGIFLTIFVYQMAILLQKKTKLLLLNPLLVTMIVIMVFLSVADISYDTYNKGGQMITSFLTPITVCLAVPLYRQMRILKENVAAVVISIVCGCVAHAATMIVMAKMLHVEGMLRDSLMSKSVTTAIALGITEELGGIQGVTVIGVLVAGIMGAVVGPAILKLVRVRNPIAFGIGLGAASHAIGTSKALEIGEVQGAMSSLAIVVTGVLTVVMVPIVVSFF